MKLFEKKQWIIIIIALIAGLILTAILFKLYFGEVNVWILATTGLIGLTITLITTQYANKE